MLASGKLVLQKKLEKNLLALNFERKCIGLNSPYGLMNKASMLIYAYDDIVKMHRALSQLSSRAEPVVRSVGLINSPPET